MKKLGIIDLAKKVASNLLLENLPDEFTYHSLKHTQEVAASTEEIGSHMGLSIKRLEIVILAAWFHDTGYTVGAENHEEASVNNARNFCNDYQYDSSKIEMIVGCILATKMPQSPKNLMEEVICDADLHHLGTSQYFTKARLLFDELKCSKFKGLEEAEWLIRNKQFIEKHTFFTEYARIKYGPKKEENLQKIIRKLTEKANG